MARPLFSVRLPRDLAEALDRIAEHAGQSRSDVVEMLIKGLDSEDRDMVLKATVAGAPTEKRNLRLSTDALTRLKQLESARKEFVANVSHELRTPLSLIKGYVETLLDGAKDNPEVAAKFLQTIERNADRLKLLIEDLLTISELESGWVKLNL